MSDRVAVMNAGRIEQLGTPADVYARPTTAYVANFLGQANVLPCRVVDRATGRVAMADGTQLSADPAAMGDGDEVLLMVRPERLRLSVNGPGVPVTAGERIFRGPIAQVTVHTAGGTPLTVVGSDLPGVGDGPLACEMPAAALVPIRA